MGIASQGEGSGLGSNGHQAPGVNMGFDREDATPDPYDTLDPVSRGLPASLPSWMGTGAQPTPRR